MQAWLGYDERGSIKERSEMQVRSEEVKWDL